MVQPGNYFIFLFPSNMLYCTSLIPTIFTKDFMALHHLNKNEFHVGLKDKILCIYKKVSSRLGNHKDFSMNLRAVTDQFHFICIGDIA